MAKEAKKDPQELTVEQKLKALFQLQTMLSKIDEIKTLRGELPLEVQDLEDEIAGLSTRIDRIKAEVAELKSAIATKKVEIETSKASIAKYKEQQELSLIGLLLKTTRLLPRRDMNPVTCRIIISVIACITSSFWPSIITLGGISTLMRHWEVTCTK